MQSCCTHNFENWKLTCQGVLSGHILFQHVSPNTLNPWLKQVASAVGDPNFASAASHGFRRGAACDMVLSGSSLAEILSAGDWRSRAFREVYSGRPRGARDGRPHRGSFRVGVRGGLTALRVWCLEENRKSGMSPSILASEVQSNFA